MQNISDKGVGTNSIFTVNIFTLTVTGITVKFHLKYSPVALK